MFSVDQGFGASKNNRESCFSPTKSRCLLLVWLACLQLVSLGMAEVLLSRPNFRRLVICLAQLPQFLPQPFRNCVSGGHVQIRNNPSSSQGWKWAKYVSFVHVTISIRQWNTTTIIWRMICWAKFSEAVARATAREWFFKTMSEGKEEDWELRVERLKFTNLRYQTGEIAATSLVRR